MISDEEYRLRYSKDKASNPARFPWMCGSCEEVFGSPLLDKGKNKCPLCKSTDIIFTPSPYADHSKKE